MVSLNQIHDFTWGLGTCQSIPFLHTDSNIFSQWDQYEELFNRKKSKFSDSTDTSIAHLNKRVFCNGADMPKLGYVNKLQEEDLI